MRTLALGYCPIQVREGSLPLKCPHFERVTNDPANVAVLSEIGARYGITLLGPPIAARLQAATPEAEQALSRGGA